MCVVGMQDACKSKIMHGGRKIAGRGSVCDTLVERRAITEPDLILTRRLSGYVLNRSFRSGQYRTYYFM